MNQGELIDAVVKNSGVSKSDASKAVKAALEEMAKTLKKGNSVRTTLGTFSVYKRSARKGLALRQKGAKMQLGYSSCVSSDANTSTSSQT